MLFLHISTFSYFKFLSCSNTKKSKTKICIHFSAENKLCMFEQSRKQFFLDKRVFQRRKLDTAFKVEYNLLLSSRRIKEKWVWRFWSLKITKAWGKLQIKISVSKAVKKVMSPKVKICWNSFRKVTFSCNRLLDFQLKSTIIISFAAWLWYKLF